MEKYCVLINCLLRRTNIIPHTNTKPNLPEGFEFLPVKRNVIINKEKFVLRYKDVVACISS